MIEFLSILKRKFKNPNPGLGHAQKRWKRQQCARDRNVHLVYNFNKGILFLFIFCVNGRCGIHIFHERPIIIFRSKKTNTFLD